MMIHVIERKTGSLYELDTQVERCMCSVKCWCWCWCSAAWPEMAIRYDTQNRQGPTVHPGPIRRAVRSADPARAAEKWWPWPQERKRK